jgi:ATP-dependent Lon protease
LDPEQNSSFYDNYLELEYDLEQGACLSLQPTIIQSIQPALRDRLEIIDLTGYAVEEKEKIAQTHLLPKQKELHGLKEYSLQGRY